LRRRSRDGASRRAERAARQPKQALTTCRARDATAAFAPEFGRMNCDTVRAGRSDRFARTAGHAFLGRWTSPRSRNTSLVARARPGTEPRRLR
jgi:hypothetical protein